MESFFLAETTKYLYLLFDPSNFLHNDGMKARLVDTPNGECVIDAGGYIFNTEAHPIDPAIVHCCSAQRQAEREAVRKWEDHYDLLSILDHRDSISANHLNKETLPEFLAGLKKIREDPQYFEQANNVDERREVVEIEFEIDESFLKGNSEVVAEEEEQPIFNQSANGGTESLKNQKAHEEETSQPGVSTQAPDDVETVAQIPSPVVRESQREERTTPLPDSSTEAPKEEASTQVSSSEEGESETKEGTTLPDKSTKSPEEKEEFVEVSSVSVEEESEKTETTKPATLKPPSKGSALKMWRTKLTEKDILEKVRALIHQARLHDEEKQEQGEISNSAERLVTTMMKIHSDYADLIKEAKELDDDYFEEVKRRTQLAKLMATIPVVTAICRNCCYPTEEIGESAAYRYWMNSVYRTHIYRRRGIDFEIGPLCWPDEEPRIEDNYRNVAPDVSRDTWIPGDVPMEVFYFPPSLTNFEIADVVDYNFDLLLTPPVGFGYKFIGLGQMIRRCLCSTVWRRYSINAFTTRTHNCGELSKKDEGRKVCVMGWLAYKRMNRFLVLRDSYGTVQAKVNPESELVEIVKNLPYESIVQVEGSVIDREENKNVKMKTGEIEIDVTRLTVLNYASSQLPMLPDTETLRMRSAVVHKMRRFLVEEAKFVDVSDFLPVMVQEDYDFHENLPQVETPTLFRRTPGGAAEFIVPAPPPNQGLCYSLPQSPQQFKQLLMVGGVDRYFQIARCYRDEGAKGDRQPEFTQVDLELSFTNQEGVMALVEDVLISAWPEEMEDLKPSARFPRLNYNDAIRLYGSDKPDMRIPWKIEDCTELLGSLGNPHSNENWKARLIVCKNQAKNMSNSVKKEFKRVLDMNKLSRPFAIFDRSKEVWFKKIESSKLIERFDVENGDCVVFSWGDEEGVQWTLGQLRNMVADVGGLRKQKKVFLYRLSAKPCKHGREFFVPCCSTLAYQLKSFKGQASLGGFKTLKTLSLLRAVVKVFNEPVIFLVDVVHCGIFPKAG
ncbi:putative aspartate--tRNA ligase [Necator americanus]|uniref:Putative aspartate--tRNA ligase n=1 Tax=Necator americanus TaxID=51031 RepID=W2SJB1_NECAM|nr:putative aspartate--tRNA ligase [Necator americanus]ETN69653.1 putative aspartate--tRNA ligase [Necator americanus]